jgi:hypothetical protein
MEMRPHFGEFNTSEFVHLEYARPSRRLAGGWA